MNPVSIFFDLAGTTRDGHYCPHGSTYIYFSTHAGGVVVGKNLTEFGLASMGKLHTLLNAALVFRWWGVV